MPAELPGFDLYEELEVSPNASTETIEAAHRSMAKRYHPDARSGGGSDTERIKRINVARDWLIDPELRARYDASRLRPESMAVPRSGPFRSEPPPGYPQRESRPRPKSDFGPNRAAVLALLIELDALKAREAAEIAGRQNRRDIERVAGAHARAFVASAGVRRDAWYAAREETNKRARAVVRNRDTAHIVGAAAAEAAGALVVADLISPTDLSLLTAALRSGAVRAKPARPLRYGAWLSVVGSIIFVLLVLRFAAAPAVTDPGPTSGSAGAIVSSRPTSLPPPVQTGGANTPPPAAGPTPSALAKPTPRGTASLTFSGRVAGKTSRLVYLECRLKPASLYDESVYLAAIVNVKDRYIGIELKDFLETRQFDYGTLTDFGATLPDPIGDTLVWSEQVAAWYDTSGDVVRKGITVTFIGTVFTSVTNDSNVITKISGTISCS